MGDNPKYNRYNININGKDLKFQGWERRALLESEREIDQLQAENKALTESNQRKTEALRELYISGAFRHGYIRLYCKCGGSWPQDEPETHNKITKDGKEYPCPVEG